MTTTQEIKKIWKDTYTIHSYEVDLKGRITFPILCQFMQESAWNHAENLRVGFTHLREKNLIWVLTRQFIRMKTFPKWGDTIQVHTWPSGKDRLFHYRDFKILDEQASLIGMATSAWFAIDLITRNPQRPDAHFHVKIEDDCERVLPDKLNRLRTIKSADGTTPIHVKYKDLDVNEHVNNARYIEWILESFPYEFQKAHTLKEVEINYLTEALYDEILAVNYEKRGNLEYFHNIVRNQDKKELCRARTLWQLNEQM